VALHERPRVDEWRFMNGHVSICLARAIGCIQSLFYPSDMSILPNISQECNDAIVKALVNSNSVRLRLRDAPRALYLAFCNTQWRHAVYGPFSISWRHAGAWAVCLERGDVNATRCTNPAGHCAHGGDSILQCDCACHRYGRYYCSGDEHLEKVEPWLREELARLGIEQVMV
jgi:hypothetical protein